MLKKSRDFDHCHQYLQQLLKSTKRIEMQNRNITEVCVSAILISVIIR
jgi:hypothetical protein